MKVVPGKKDDNEKPGVDVPISEIYQDRAGTGSKGPEETKAVKMR